MATSEEDTKDFRRQKSFAEDFFAPNQPRCEMRIAAATHVGRARSRNEDHYAIIRNCRSREVLSTNLPDDALSCPDDATYAMVVADGIGGAPAGDVASQLAIRTMFELASRATSWVMKFTDLQAQEIHERVAAYLTEMQSTLRSQSRADPALAEMGTTWTSAHVAGPHAIIVHIGDSRAYLYRDDTLQLITRDQTLGQEMVETGRTETEARRCRHILTNSLGSDRESVLGQIYHVELRPEDRLLLCTDGLSNMVTAPLIAHVLAGRTAPQVACTQLVDYALDAGGRDNVTVVLCDVLSEREDRVQSAGTNRDPTA